jgi:hypothetical protein
MPSASKASCTKWVLSNTVLADAEARLLGISCAVRRRLGEGGQNLMQPANAARFEYALTWNSHEGLAVGSLPVIEASASFSLRPHCGGSREASCRSAA